jgi:hypothetical protein
MSMMLVGKTDYVWNLKGLLTFPFHKNKNISR